jgi:chemotaxis protein histidine kinase CheA
VETIFLQKEIHGKDFFDVIGFTGEHSEKRKILSDYLSLLRQNIISDAEKDELNPYPEILLKNPVDRSNQWITLQYFAMNTGKGDNDGIVLVVGENITLQKEMSAKISQSEQENLYLKAIAEDPDLFREFLKEMRSILFHTEKKMDQLEITSNNRAVVSEIYRDVHTIKDTSSAFCLNAVAQIAGEMEENLEPLLYSGSITIGMIEATKTSLALLLRTIMEVVEGAKQIMGDDMDMSDTCLRISLNKLRNEYRAIHALPVEQGSNRNNLTQLQVTIQQKFRELCSVPALKGFGRALRIIPDLIRRLKKQVNFQLVGGEILIDYEIARELNNPLVHLIRNSFDHGIELTEERLTAGKQEQGKITITVLDDTQGIVLKITDDGRGIDPEKLRKAARAKNIISHEKANTLTRKECFDLMFLSGVSTVETVTDISGRGVGMDAVFVTVNKTLNGSIEVSSELGVGAEIIIRVPKYFL